MRHVDAGTADQLWHDFDAREVLLRRVVTDRLAEAPTPAVPGHVVASYFLALRTHTLEKTVKEFDGNPDHLPVIYPNSAAAR